MDIVNNPIIYVEPYILVVFFAAALILERYGRWNKGTRWVKAVCYVGLVALSLIQFFESLSDDKVTQLERNIYNYLVVIAALEATDLFFEYKYKDKKAIIEKDDKANSKHDPQPLSCNLLDSLLYQILHLLLICIVVLIFVKFI